MSSAFSHAGEAEVSSGSALDNEIFSGHPRASAGTSAASAEGFACAMAEGAGSVDGTRAYWRDRILQLVKGKLSKDVTEVKGFNPIIKNGVKSFVKLRFTNNQNQFDESGLAEDIDKLADEVRMQALVAPLKSKSDTERARKILATQVRKGKYFEGVFCTYSEFQAELLRRGIPDYDQRWKGLSRQDMSDEMLQKERDKRRHK